MLQRKKHCSHDTFFTAVRSFAMRCSPTPFCLLDERAIHDAAAGAMQCRRELLRRKIGNDVVHTPFANGELLLPSG